MHAWHGVIKIALPWAYGYPLPAALFQVLSMTLSRRQGSYMEYYHAYPQTALNYICSVSTGEVPS